MATTGRTSCALATALFIASAFDSAPRAAEPPATHESFQLLLGTNRVQTNNHALTDGAEFVRQLRDGDLLVAGYGASHFTDVGGFQYPMLARIDGEGHVLWQRIYTELPGHRIVGLRESAEGILVLFADAGLGTHLSLRRFDGNGEPGSTIAEIDNAQLRGAFRNRMFTGFLIALPDATGSELSRMEAANADAFSLALLLEDGRIIPVASPAAFAPLRQASDDPGAFLFVENGLQPLEVVGFDADLGIARRLALSAPLYIKGGAYPPGSLAQSDSHLFVLESRPHGRRQSSTMVLESFAEDGERTWQAKLGRVDVVHKVFVAANRDLVVTAEYECSPLVLRVGSDGRIKREARIRIAGRCATIGDAIELADGRVAVVGATRDARRTTGYDEGDAFLAVTDLQWQGFAELGRCLAPRRRLESAADEILSRTGVVVIRDPTPAIVPGPLDVDIAVPTDSRFDCGEPSESDFTDFLDAAVVATRRIHAGEKQSRGSSTTADTYWSQHPLLFVRARGRVGGTGYRESLEYGPKDPRIVAEVGLGQEAMEFALREMVPYADRMERVLEALAEAHIILVTAGRDDARYGTASYRERVIAAERVVDLYQGLSRSERSALAITHRFFALGIADEPGVLEFFGEAQLDVGLDRVDDVFPYLLGELLPIERRMAALRQQFSDNLNISVSSIDRRMAPDERLHALERLWASAERLDDRQRERVRRLDLELSIGREPGIEFFGTYERRVDVGRPNIDQAFDFVLANEALIARSPTHRF